MSIKYREDSITGIRKREAQQTKIAESSVLIDGSIHLTLPGGHVCDGTMVKFCAPCSCEVVTGGIVINGETYTVVDSMLNCVTGFGGVWDVGAQISVVIDDTNKRAFLNNTSDPLPTLKLSAPPTFETVGRFGQHAICGKIVYICLGSIANGEEIKYIWHKVTTKKAILDMLVFTESQTLNISDLGLKVGDEVIVACVSGGNGGNKGPGSSSSYGGRGGAAGKGGAAVSGSAGTSTSKSVGGGGGAGGGYGAGGGGGGTNNYGGVYNGNGTTNGGRGGSCIIQTVVLAAESIPITIGAAGAANGGTGGTTSFGTDVSVTGGGGSLGGKVGNTASYSPDSQQIYLAQGGGGGGGGGWLYTSGYELAQLGAGSDGSKGTISSSTNGAGGRGGNGGGYGQGAGAGGTAGQWGEDTKIGAGHGVVYLWY